MDIFHADADLLYNTVPDPPFALQAIEQDPVLILLLEVLPHMLHLLLVTRVTNVEDLRAVVHQVRPAVGGYFITLSLKVYDFKRVNFQKKKSFY